MNILAYANPIPCLAGDSAGCWMLVQDVRYASEQDTLPDGSFIPKGCQVVYSAYVVNRMTSYWGSDADTFR